MGNYKITPAEEARAAVMKELTNAELKLREMKVLPTAEDLISIFSLFIQQMLTNHFTNIRVILDNVEKRETELLFWMGEVKRMMEAVEKYQQGFEEKNLQFLEDAKNLFESRVKYFIKPHYN